MKSLSRLTRNYSIK